MLHLIVLLCWCLRGWSCVDCLCLWVCLFVIYVLLFWFCLRIWFWTFDVLVLHCCLLGTCLTFQLFWLVGCLVVVFVGFAVDDFAWLECLVLCLNFGLELFTCCFGVFVLSWYCSWLMLFAFGICLLTVDSCLSCFCDWCFGWQVLLETLVFVLICACGLTFLLRD